MFLYSVHATVTVRFQCWNLTGCVWIAIMVLHKSQAKPEGCSIQLLSLHSLILHCKRTPLCSNLWHIWSMDASKTKHLKSRINKTAFHCIYLCRESESWDRSWTCRTRSQVQRMRNHLASPFSPKKTLACLERRAESLFQHVILSLSTAQ